MVRNSSDIVICTVAEITKNLPNLSTAKLGQEFYYQSLPLCVIDSVFSIGVQYINAQRAVEAWCQAQQPEWQKYPVDDMPRYTISDLIRAGEGHDESSLSTKFFGGNRQRTSTESGILKAQAVFLFAKALQVAGIDDFRDARNEFTACRAREEVGKVTGQKSGISFDYFLMMAGDDSYVKADE